jgi:hypothetical protein
MTISQRNTTVGSSLAATVAIVLLLAAGASAAPSKLRFTGQFGKEVNETTKGNLCTVQSGDRCQNGQFSEASAGFSNPYSVAAGPSLGPGVQGNVYVGDTINARIQEFTAAGAFVSMFGWNVNKTKVEQVGAEQAAKNLCTAKSGDACQKGEEGGLAGQIARPESVAVDQSTGDIYVLSEANHRVEKYTAEGQFVLMIGKEVNETTKGNLCTAVSKNACQAGVANVAGSTEHGAFNPGENRGDLLALGGPEDLLYVGDQERVQEFNKAGEWVNEVSLASLSSNGQVRALAVAANGTLYFAYAEEEVIHVYPPGGGPSSFPTGGGVSAIALDSFGDVAVTVFGAPNGELYSAAGNRLAEFGPPSGINVAYGIAFNSEGTLYAADSGREDIEMFALVPVGELVTGACKNRTATGITLTGEVNPEGLTGEQTRAWFQYGTSLALGSNSPKQEVGTGSAFVPIEATLTNLRPNQTYYYRVAAEDQNDRAPEPPLVAEATLSCAITALPPAVEGEPSAFEVTFSSAVLSATLNPENANTVYRFQYAPCANLNECTGVLETPALESSAFGVLGASQSVSALAPSTTYHYRLIAVNEFTEQTIGREGSFTTPPAPSPTATTGPAGGVTATTATLTGVVDPDGAGATYAFQVGVYNGAGTVYTTIVQGSTGSEVGPVPESFTLTGLQPGTTYAYRVTISSAYGVSEGTPVTFTTAGLPAVLFAPTVLAQLPVPNIAFPKAVTTTTTKALTNAQKLASALKVCKRKPKKQRAGCERNARKKYRTKSKKKK